MKCLIYKPMNSNKICSETVFQSCTWWSTPANECIWLHSYNLFFVPL